MSKNRIGGHASRFGSNRPRSIGVRDTRRPWRSTSTTAPGQLTFFESIVGLRGLAWPGVRRTCRRRQEPFAAVCPRALCDRSAIARTSLTFRTIISVGELSIGFPCPRIQTRRNRQAAGEISLLPNSAWRRLPELGMSPYQPVRLHNLGKFLADKVPKANSDQGRFAVN